MKVILVLISLVLAFSLNPNVYAAYQEQELTEVTVDDLKEERALPSRRKQYPILNEFEKQLYPGRNFHKEDPGKRLERIEIAVFGNKQSGGIKSRITALENELEAWTIAHAKVPSKSSSKNSKLVQTPVNQFQQPYYQPAPVARTFTKPKKQVDYDYMNYRMVTPLIQNAGRRAISRVFANDRN